MIGNERKRTDGRDDRFIGLTGIAVTCAGMAVTFVGMAATTGLPRVEAVARAKQWEWVAQSSAVLLTGCLATVVAAVRKHSGLRIQIWRQMQRWIVVMLSAVTVLTGLSSPVRYVEASPAALKLTWLASAAAGYAAYLLIRRSLGPPSRTQAFAGASVGTLCVGTVMATAAAIGGPILTGTPLNARVVLPTQITDPPSRPAPEDPNAEVDPCAVAPAIGVGPPNVALAMNQASRDGSAKAFGCLMPAMLWEGGSVQQPFEKQRALLVGSSHGAGVTSTPYRETFEDAGGVTLSALNSQIRTRFDCGQGRDFQFTTNSSDEAVLMASRVKHPPSDGEPHLTPTALLREWTTYFASGLHLVATADMSWPGANVAQTFVDQYGNEHTLSAPAPNFAAEPDRPAHITMQTVYAACNPGKPVPASLR